MTCCGIFYCKSNLFERLKFVLYFLCKKNKKIVIFIVRNENFRHLIVDMFFMIYYNNYMNNINPNNILSGRVAFKIFGMEIYWYGIIITFAIMLAFGLAFLLCKRKNLSSNLPYEIIIAILPLGILSARLFAVLFDSGLTIADYFKFRDGGMSIIGAIIGGLVGIIILCLVRKHNFLEVTDLLVTLLILAQGIGRWGNFANGEVYGQVVTNPAFQVFPFAVKINGEFYEALFFYESVLDILGFVGLICIYWFTKKKGLCLGTYLVYYGTIRAILEPRRQSEYILRLGSLPISQIMSFAMIAFGVGVFVYVFIKEYKNKGKKDETKKVLHSN